MKGHIYTMEKNRIYNELFNLKTYLILHQDAAILFNNIDLQLLVCTL